MEQLPDNNNPAPESCECIFCGRADFELLQVSPGGGDLLRCRSCGLLFRKRLPGVETLIYVNPNKSLADFSERFYQASRGTMEFILRRAARVRRPPGEFLDVGCGTGRMMRAAKQVDWNVRGLEVNENDVVLCRNLGFEVFHGMLNDFNAAKDSFDAVSLIEVCEFLPDPVGELSRVREILKPGGVVMFRVLNASAYLAVHRTFQRFGGLLSKLGLRDPAVFHWVSFSPANFRWCLERAGLRVVEISPSPANRGDPYEFNKKPLAKSLVYALFPFYERLVRLIFAASGKRLILTPAFIAVCAKNPEPHRRVKVLQVITRMDHGGSADDTARIVKGMSRDKYENHFLCGSMDQLSETELRELKNTCAGFTIEPSLKRNPNPIHDLKALWRLFRFIRKGRFDIVHTHTAKAGFVGRLAAWLAGTPVIVHSTHGHVFYGYFGKLKTKIFVTMEKIAAKVSDRVLCLTELEIDDHIELGIGFHELFRYVYSGVPLDVFSKPVKSREEVRASLGLPGDAIVIGTVARIDPVKGIRYAVEAFQQLYKEHPRAHLVLVGDGGDRPALEAAAREYGISDRTHFLGHRTDVPDLLHAMDIFLLPSLNEGYGKAIVEAMCAGLPVVATRVGGVPELIKDGETGLLVSPADPAAIARAVGGLIRDTEQRHRLAAAANRNVTDIFGVEAMIRRHDEIYTEFLRTRVIPGLTDDA
jgi:glycosyltransferase involved in cell wall biosynthesis/SAM-dependent methyltransferase